MDLLVQQVQSAPVMLIAAVVGFFVFLTIVGREIVRRG
jgi:hypothetical protein